MYKGGEFGLNLNDRWNCSRFDSISLEHQNASGQTIKFFDKLSKGSQKGNLELPKIENCTTTACTELIKSTQ